MALAAQRCHRGGFFFSRSYDARVVLREKEENYSAGGRTGPQQTARPEETHTATLQPTSTYLADPPYPLLDIGESLPKAIEEAEDVLDELGYYRLEKKAKATSNKVISSVYKCKRQFIQQFNATFKAGTFKRMVDAMKKLGEVVAGVERFIILVDRFDSCSLKYICHQNVASHRETSSFLIEETIIGRETEKDKIIEWLVEQGAEYHNPELCNVNLIALLGMGGMGKTTLA
jgi:hypothetical protein